MRGPQGGGGEALLGKPAVAHARLLLVFLDGGYRLVRKRIEAPGLHDRSRSFPAQPVIGPAFMPGLAQFTHADSSTTCPSLRLPSLLNTSRSIS